MELESLQNQQGCVFSHILFRYFNLLNLGQIWSCGEWKQAVMSPAYQTPNLILIKCCFFNKVDCYNNNVLGWRVLAPDKRIVFGPPSSFKGKLISLSKLDIFSLGKAIEANTYIVLGLKGKFYTGDNQKCSCISFFSSKNRVSSTNLESCHNGKVFFFRGGGEYTVLGKERKTFPGSVVFFFFFSALRNPLLRHHWHEMSLMWWPIYKNLALLQMGLCVQGQPVTLSEYLIADRGTIKAISCYLY